MMPKGIVNELGYGFYKGDFIPLCKIIEYSKKPIGLIYR
jgi:hypothetical protein